MLVTKGRPNVEQGQGRPWSGLSENFAALLKVTNFISSQILRKKRTNQILRLMRGQAKNSAYSDYIESLQAHCGRNILLAYSLQTQLAYLINFRKLLAHIQQERHIVYVDFALCSLRHVLAVH